MRKQLDKENSLCKESGVKRMKDLRKEVGGLSEEIPTKTRGGKKVERKGQQQGAMEEMKK